MKKQLILPLCLLPLIGCSEEPTPVVPAQQVIETTAANPDAALAEGDLPDDIAAEIEADHGLAADLPPDEAQAPGKMESLLGGAGAGMDSAIRDIVPALEETGAAIKDSTEQGVKKGAEVVDALSEEGGRLMQQEVKPALKRGAELLDQAGEAARHKGTELMDALKAQPQTDPEPDSEPSGPQLPPGQPM
ncbi:MAG: hypothetical protein H7842_05185 [Gammaproteobacteria bacterium SHHR-1]|uniref:hypothetical protein n=1 Tax=Magnetovirga frankeli TaxID=947516 RepID=UPI001293A5D0|nr:hypothetical protein D5125_13580 [gamma proteobacterium SS-5]